MPLIRCDCDHSYQSKKYGENIRVGNKLGNKDVYRCTICGNMTGQVIKGVKI